MNNYEAIFKRKSFHFFIGGEATTEEDLKLVNNFIKEVKPLYDDIKTEIIVVPEKETTCHRGADYCVLFYSEPKGEYLRNIGYIGEQIDLYLNSIGLGALWFGIGKPKEVRNNGLEYVIMLAFKRMPVNSFRKDMFKSKRKLLDEIWSGESIDDVTNIVRFAPSACNTQPWYVENKNNEFAPSACNTQPWYVENKNNELFIYRYKKPGKRGIMPINQVMYYNHIDIGIFLFILETCLSNKNIAFERTLMNDESTAEVEKTLVAVYKI